MAIRGRKPGEKSRGILIKVPVGKAEEIERFANARGLKLATYCASLVWQGFEHDKAVV